MKTEMLKELLQQYPDGSIPFVSISIGTTHRLGRGIEAAKHDGDLFEVKGVEKDAKTGSPVLLLEVRR